MNIYAVRDLVANEYIGRAMYTLMVFRTDQEAARYFADAVNDHSSMINKHPKDYELWKIGEIHESGQIMATEAFGRLTTAEALLTPDGNADLAERPERRDFQIRRSS